MSAEVIPFAFEDNLIRVVEIDGEPWFVGRDICRALGIANSSDALGRLDEDERQFAKVAATKGVGTADPLSSEGNAQETTVVSEPGVYRLVFTSRRPEAERFKRWIAHEVLPALRRRGFYALPAAEDEIDDLGPIGVVSTKLALIRECRLAFGDVGARALWHKLKLPTTDGPASPRSSAEAADLMARFLAEEIDGDELVMSIARQIEFAWDGSEATAKALARWGVIVGVEKEDGFLLHHGSADLLDLFLKLGEGVDWWRTVRSLPGNRPGPKMRLAGKQARTTFVSVRWLDAAAKTK